MSPHHRRTRWIGAALAVGLCLVLVNRPGTEAPAGAAPLVETAAPVRTTLAGHPVWAHFANPRAYPGGVDDTIHAELRRLIRNAAPGSVIRGSIHSLNMVPVAQELVNAQNQRKVRVQLAVDGKNTRKDPDDENAAVTLLRKVNGVTFCKDGTALGCVSDSDDGIMHAKLFTFTATTDPTGTARKEVSWFGSPNLTDTSGSKQFNNAITVYGDRALFTGLNTFLGDMYERNHPRHNDYYDSGSGRGYYMAAAADAYASPEQRGETDTIASRLNDLTPDASCRVRIGMKSVTSKRPKLVALLKDFRKAGCLVWMVVTEKDGDPDMTGSVHDELTRAGVRIRAIPNLHDKYFLVHGRYDGVYQYRVYTGSQNWTEDALIENDEIFVKMAPETGDRHPLYDGYLAHFDDAYQHGNA